MTRTGARIKGLFNRMFGLSSRSGPQPAGGPQAAQPTSGQDDLWDAAYRALAAKTDKTHELVQNYEILLSRYLKESKRVCKL